MRLRLLALAASLWAEPAAAQQPDSVWVNTRSGVYHCRGTRDFGKTKRGELLLESEAVLRGNRPNGGVRCAPAGAGAGSRNELPPKRPAGATRACTVTRISDGDTIECAPAGRVRLIGIDSPEADQEPYGSAATAALAAVLPVGATIQLEGDREATDRFGRTLAYIWYDGHMLNWQLVRDGWAVTLRYAPNVRYAERFDAAEARARFEARGLWSGSGFACRPRDHRARRC